MEEDRRPVEEYLQATNAVMEYFHCRGDFFIRPMLDAEWNVRNMDDFHILTYRNGKGKKIDAIVVSRAGVPMVFETKSHTMVVGIDCVKIGFVFSNRNKRM